MENINEKVSVKRNALLNVIYTLVNIIFPVITFPYVSRVLSVEKMGAVSFYSSISNYAIIFGSLGVSVYGIRACAKVRDNKKILSQTVAELEVITLFATSIVITVLIVASNFINRLNSEPLLLAINLVLVFSSAFSFDWLYSGVEQYDYITKRTIAIKLISLMLVYIFVKDREDYYIYALIIAFSTVGANILNLLHTRKFVSINLVGRLRLKNHFGPMLLLFSSVLAVSVYTNLDTVMIGFISGDREVGLYTVAVKSKTLLLTTINAISTVLLPRLSYYFSNRMKDAYNRTIKRSVSIIFMISIPLTFFFIIEAYDCILLLGGRDYAEATLCMKIIMPILLISSFSNITGNQVLIPLGKYACFMKAVVAGAVVNLLLNSFMIPYYGANGAAIATLFAEITQMAIQFVYSRKYIIPSINKITILKIVISTLCGIIALLFIRRLFNFNAFINLAFFSVCYFSVYMLGLVIMKENTFKELLGEILALMLKKQSEE